MILSKCCFYAYVETEPLLSSTHPTVTSKMFDPTEDETAMSPNPFRATMTLVIRSGMEVPAARNVRPITCKKRKIMRWTLYSDAHKGVSALISGLLFWYPDFCRILKLAHRHS